MRRGSETRGVTSEDAGAGSDLERALRDALDATDGDPVCAVCPSTADFFLYAPDRVRRFVCWEHVSPYAAAVDPADAPEPATGHALDRPVAVSLD